MKSFIQECAPGVWRHTPEEGKGPSLAVVGSMHGDERFGALLIQELIQPQHPIWETEARHKSILFAIGNPLALRADHRVRPGGEDLNRLFGAHSTDRSANSSYETERVNTLKSALAKTDILIDLHQTSCSSPPVAVIPSSREHRTLASVTGVQTGVLGADHTYGSRMLSDWFNANRGVGITVETGQIGTQEAMDNARSILDNFLGGLWSLTPNDHTIHLYRIRETMVAPGDDLTWLRHLGNTSPVYAGETIATSRGGPLIVTRDGATFLPQQNPKKGESCVLIADDLGQQRSWSDKI